MTDPRRNPDPAPRMPSAAKRLAQHDLEAAQSALLGAIPLPVAVMRTTDSTILYLNDPAITLLLTGGFSDDLERQMMSALAAAERVTGEGAASEIETAFCLPNGRALPMLLSARRFQYAGDPVLLAMMTPISRLKQLEFEALAAAAEAEAAHRLLQDSLTYAATIQRALLPQRLDARGALDAALLWQPVAAVGGDFYMVRRNGHRVAVGVFDCTGHGVPGAFMTVIALGALDDAFGHDSAEDPGLLLGLLDSAVRVKLGQHRADALSDDGLDGGLCVIDLETRRLSFAGAQIPLIIQQPDGTLTTLAASRASLGYRRKPARGGFIEHHIALHPGQRFFLATDGIVEQPGGTPDRPRLFGRKRLCAALSEAAHLPLSEQIAAAERALRAWQGREPQRDDRTLLGFQVY